MRYITTNRLLAYAILLTFCFCNVTCKKIWKYPNVSMYGIWACDHDECAYIKLEIRKNGSGNYGPGCEKVHAKGKVRFTDEALFVGDGKLRFVHKPEYVTGNDSIEISGLDIGAKGKNRIIAKMTIHEGGLRGSKTYTLYKIINY